MDTKKQSEKIIARGKNVYLTEELYDNTTWNKWSNSISQIMTHTPDMIQWKEHSITYFLSKHKNVQSKCDTRKQCETRNPC
jgi:hypothetical protein